jgi:hypothetical protein
MRSCLHNAYGSVALQPAADQDIAVTLLSNMEDGVWDPVWKIHEMVVEGQMT